MWRYLDNERRSDSEQGRLWGRERERGWEGRGKVDKLTDIVTEH